MYKKDVRNISIELLESPSIDPSHFPPNHLCFQHQPSDKWSGKQTEISFNTEPQKLLGEDKNTLSINTNILLADGGDILNEAVSTAISIVKPQRILTNVLLLEQKWPLYCPQGSGMLRQQLLMMHSIAWYYMVLLGIVLYCMELHHGIGWYCMVLHGTT